MEEPPNGLTNPTDLGLERCLVRGDGLSLACRSSSMSESSPCSFFILSRISSRISVSSVSVSFRRCRAKCFSTLPFRLSASDRFARLLASSSLIFVMAPLTPANSLMACVTGAVSIGGSLMAFSVDRDSFEDCLWENGVIPTLEQRALVRQQLAERKHATLLLKTDQPAAYIVV